MEGLLNNQGNSNEIVAIKEGVDYIFEQNPELEAIGNKEQYSEYLDTVFPNSKTKEIYYHGTAKKEKIENFDFSRSNFAKAVFFTNSLPFAKAFAFDEVRNGSVQGQVLDIQNTFNFSNPDHIESLREKIAELVEENYSSSTGIKFRHDLPSVQIGEKIIDNPTIDDFIDYYMWRLQNGSWRIIETDRIINFISQKYDSIKIIERGNTNIAVFQPTQIHVLGSTLDVNKFKNFCKL